MLSSVYLFICQMLWLPPCIETTIDICYDKSSIYFCYLLSIICRLVYAMCHMSVFIWRIPCASYCEFTVISQLICQSQYQLLYALYQTSHASYSIPIFICRHMSAKCFLWVAKLAYMSILVAICQTAISQSICQVLYFICYMPNAMCYMPNSVC
jgi:hypothetical protein